MPFVRRCALFFCAVLCLAWQHPAEARRAALIIGNSGYLNTSALPNPGNDAKLVAAAARKAGFDVVLVADVGKAGFDQALREFRSRADGAEVGLIYYAGHGIENGGKNWLIPIDAKLAESRDLRFEAIELDGLLETLSNAQRRVVILDACRNNPFGSNWLSGVRAVQRGLATQEVEGALVIYAATSGQVATDGTGGNSPFATAIAKRLPEPGLLLQMLGPKVTDDVVASTGGLQRPWTNSGMGGQEFYLVPLEREAAKPAPAAEASAAANGSGEAYAWRYADKADTIEDYTDYLGKFPNGAFAKDARERIERLRKSGTHAALAPPPLPAPSATEARSNNAVVAIATSELAMPKGNKLTDLAPLPDIPSAPLFPKEGYPDCRESHQSMTSAIERVQEINRCLGLLNAYYSDVLNGYRTRMAEHQNEVSQLYAEKVGGNGKYTPESQAQFYRAVMTEHTASSPAGAHFAGYRAAEKKYREDRAYLEDRYCFNTGSCGGYPPPRGAAAPGEVRRAGSKQFRR